MHVGGVAVAFVLLASAGGMEPQCETLPMQSYVQHKAPTDVTGDVTQIINAESHEPIEDVRVIWLGSAVHASVGLFDIVANVTLAGGRGTRCYTRQIEVTDTNECDESTPSSWRHRCDSSARCVNTIGSYECACEEGYFAPRSAPFGCGGYSSTSACCSDASRRLPKGKGSHDADGCVASFKCEPDHCATVCVREASCLRTTPYYGNNRREARYECSCKEGWIGTGRTCPDGGRPPAVFIDDATGWIHHDGEMPCGCQVGLKDPCSGVVDCGEDAVCVPHTDGTAECRCLPGFAQRNATTSRRDGPTPVICIDETLPELELRGPSSLEITQCGEPYEEFGVLIVDDIATHVYERSLRITYSNPRDFPNRGAGYREGKTPFFKRGDYLVSYRIDTQWRTPAYIETTRLVSVVDEDECGLSPSHPCAPRCAPFATCVNEVGGYRCVCPDGAVGDGFLGPNGTNAPPDYWLVGHGADNPDAWRVPRTFAGGTGCTDVEKPNLVLIGPNPVTLRTERCVGLTLASRYLASRKATRTEPPASTAALDAEVAELVALAPEVLCDQTDPTRCAVAYDTNPLTGEQVDLSSRVAVGRPFQIDRKAHHPRNSLAYYIPYSVTDDAGNVATEFRELLLKVMTVDDVESEVRAASPPAACDVEQQQQQQRCPPCDKPPPPPPAASVTAKPFCKCDDDVERRRVQAESETVALRRYASRLEAEKTSLERRLFIWSCAAIIACVVAGVAIYIASDAAATSAPTHRDRTHDVHKTPVPQPKLPGPLGTPNAPSALGAPRSGGGYQTPGVVRGTPRQSPYST